MFEADHLDPSIGEVGIDPSGAHLRHAGAAELYVRAAELTEAVGRKEPFDACRPWRAAFHLMSCVLPSFGLFHEYGMESRLRVHADVGGLRTGFLEAPQTAFQLIDAACAPEKDGLAFLEYVVESTISGEGKAILLRILRSWARCDMAELAAIQSEQMLRFPYLHESLISRRNDAWLPAIQRLLADSTPTLLVIGSLHLVGTHGLLSTLEDCGFRFDGGPNW